MSSGFSVTFNGELVEGFDPDLVKTRFGDRFGLSGKQLEKIFSARRVVLKKGLAEAQASVFRRELGAIGLQVDVCNAAGQVVPEPADVVAVAGGGDDFDPVYRILYSGGLLPGCERDRVMEAAGRRLKLGERQLKTVFSGREIGLKQGLNLNEARRYFEVLCDLGMDVRCEPPLPQPGPLTDLQDPKNQGSASSAAEQDLARTVMWSDPLVQDQAVDSEDDRLVAALRAEFDFPGGGAPAAPMQSFEAIELAAGPEKAEPHLAQTMLNPDALRAYLDDNADQFAHAPTPMPAVEMPAAEMHAKAAPIVLVAERRVESALADESPASPPLTVTRPTAVPESVPESSMTFDAASDTVMAALDEPVAAHAKIPDGGGRAAMDHTTAILLGVIAALVVVLVVVLSS